jgi:hypothetical protein
MSKSCPTIVKIKPKPIPYSTRMIIVDQVGFEPTTSAQKQLLDYRYYIKKCGHQPHQ